MTLSRWFWFRALAICLGLSPWLLIEGTLWLMDLPRHRAIDDPLVDLHALRPLFTPSADGQRKEIGPERRNWFDYDSFPIKKSPSTYRIFVLGGSTVQGEPYHSASAFSTWLRLSLEVADPSRRFEVINCGGLSYASYRVGVILEEVLQYDPDLIIVYSGHNEFLEDRTYAMWNEVPRPVARVLGLLGQTRCVQFGRGLFVPNETTRSHSPSETRTQLPSEVFARLDRIGGLDEYQRDDPWRQSVLAHYRRSMTQMVRACARSKTPLILCVPVSNERDVPPFKVTESPSLSVAELARFRSLMEIATDHSSQLSDRRNAAEEALKIDPHHAGAAFIAGRLALHAGDRIAGKELLCLARDWDVCPLRMPSELATFLRKLAADTKTPLVDVAQIFADLSPDGIPGDNLLVDHVHPSIPGHQKIAEAIFSTMEEQRWINRPKNYEDLRQCAFLAHSATLGEAYYQHGLQRLEGLRLWASRRSP